MGADDAGGSGRGGFVPGASVLGGAAAGLSYEGAVRDAMAREERSRRRAEAASRRMPPPQSQRPGNAQAEPQRAAQAALQAGR